MPILLNEGASLLHLHATLEKEIAFAIGLVAVGFGRFELLGLDQAICNVVELDVLANLVIGSRADPAALLAVPLLVWI